MIICYSGPSKLTLLIKADLQRVQGELAIPYHRKSLQPYQLNSDIKYGGTNWMKNWFVCIFPRPAQAQIGSASLLSPICQKRRPDVERNWQFSSNNFLNFDTNADLFSGFIMFNHYMNQIFVVIFGLFVCLFFITWLPSHFLNCTLISNSGGTCPNQMGM